MSGRLAVALAVSLLFAPATPLRAADWNQWRGPNRDGLAPDSPPLLEVLPDEGLRPLWVSEAEIPASRDGGWASPAVAGGRVYVFAHTRTRLAAEELPKAKYPYLPPEKRSGLSDEEYAEYERKRRIELFERGKRYRFEELVYCLDGADGRTLWKYARPSLYSRWPQSGSPAVVDGRVFVLGAARVVRCLDAESGAELWTTRLPGDFHDEYWQSSFAVADGVAVVLAGSLVGLDAATGRLLWEGDRDDMRGEHSSPAVWEEDGGPLVIANVARGDTVGVEPRTGRERWRVKSGAGRSTPLVVGDKLLTYGSSRKQGLRCFDLSADSAEPRWVFQGTADPGSTPVALGGHVYVQGEKRLACVDLASGEAAWMVNLDLARPRYASLVAADDKVFYAWQGLLAVAADPSSYRLLMEARFDGEHRMAPEAAFRRELGIDELEKTAEGQMKAEKLWKEKIGRHGPVTCTTPALADGRLYLRMRGGIACYDLAAPRQARR